MKNQITASIAAISAVAIFALVPSAAANASGANAASTKSASSSPASGHQIRHREYHMSDLVITSDTSSATAVFLGGTPIMRFRNSAGGYSPEQRASETQLRLNDVLSQGPIAPSDIETSEVGGDAIVTVKGQLLFTADVATAVVNDATPMELANIWADRMRSVLPDLTAPH